MPRDIAGVSDERDAASRAPPQGGGRGAGRAPAARAVGRWAVALQEPALRGSELALVQRANPRRLDRALANGDRRRAWFWPKGALQANPDKINLVNAAPPNADERTDGAAPGRCVSALQDRDFPEGGQPRHAYVCHSSGIWEVKYGGPCL